MVVLRLWKNFVAVLKVRTKAVSILFQYYLAVPVLKLFDLFHLSRKCLFCRCAISVGNYVCFARYVYNNYLKGRTWLHRAYWLFKVLSRYHSAKSASNRSDSWRVAQAAAMRSWKNRPLLILLLLFTSDSTKQTILMLSWLSPVPTRTATSSTRSARSWKSAGQNRSSTIAQAKAYGTRRKAWADCRYAVFKLPL